jgi:integral membrane sensor domain MASE1
MNIARTLPSTDTVFCVISQDPRAIEQDSFLVDLILWPVIVAPVIAAVPAALLIHLRYKSTSVKDDYITWAIGDASGNYFTLYLLLVSRHQRMPIQLPVCIVCIVCAHCAYAYV